MKTGCALKSTRPLVASVVVMMAIVLTHASTLYQRGKRKPGACWQTQSMDEPQVEAVRRQLKHPVEHAQRSTCPQSQRRARERSARGRRGRWCSNQTVQEFAAFSISYQKKQPPR
eukprot:COSAG02_NODE_2778_length_8051_cov_829.131162_6_plen_115_part_00